VKISNISIKHFTSIESVEIVFHETIALVGQNNAGKSNILKALDVFFDPSASKITEDSFYSRDISMPIEIAVLFTSLNETEEEYFRSYVQDNALKVKRKIEWDSSSSKPKIHHIGYRSVPKVDWLNEEKISGSAIDQWWATKSALSIEGIQFASHFKSKPNVTSWKEAATAFISEHKNIIRFEEIERENIAGFEGVLKGGLPKFVLLPAVRDVLDEAKSGKTNPFGTLINSIEQLATDEDKTQLKKPLGELSKLLNAQGASNRMGGVTSLETALNKNLAELIPGCTLELDFQTPTIQDLLGGIRILADDGFKGAIEGKGHGFQRYVIFTILKTYAERLRTTGDGERQRSIVFAIEEPEIYLHPQAQRAMYRALFEIGQRGDQVVYSTHSSLMVDITFFDRLCLVSRKNVGGKYRTEVKQLSVQQMIDDLKIRYPRTSPTEESIRERYAHVYTPSRNEGFFAQRIILVEGPTEEYAVPIFCQALRYDLDREGVAIISAGGKGTLDRLLRVYNEFGIPCYVVFDGDNDKDDAENRRITKELLELLGYDKTEPSETIVESRFAMFENEFEKTLEEEVSDYSDLVEEARRNLGLKTGSGEPLVARYISIRLVQKGKSEGDEDKYVPPTITEIINMTKQVEWKSSLLKVDERHGR
jgi:predicted ATPase